MSSKPAPSTALQRVPSKAEAVALLAELTPRQRAVVVAMLNGAATITEAGEIAGYAQPAQRASEALKKSNVQVALRAGLMVKADKARGVLERIDATVRKVAHAMENAPTLVDPVALTVQLEKLMSAQRVAMEIADRGGGDREERFELWSRDYYTRIERWTRAIERRGLAAAQRAARIAHALGAGLTSRHH